MTRLLRVVFIIGSVALACACVIRLIERTERHEHEWRMGQSKTFQRDFQPGTVKDTR